MIKDLVASCRSYRRFYEEERIPYEELKDMDIQVYNIGDSNRVHNIMYAIWDAFEVANHI